MNKEALIPPATALGPSADGFLDKKAFLDFATCGSCGYCITAERHVKKRNVALVALLEEWKERFLAKVETWEDEASETKQKKIDALRTDLASLKAKLER